MCDDIYTFRGRVTYERYYNEDSYYGVYNIQTKDNLPHSVRLSPFESNEDEEYFSVSIAGKVQQLYVGSEYNFIAKPEYRDKYQSWSYVPSSVTAVAPKSIEESKLFLESILTHRQASTLLEQYPTVVQDVIDGKDNIDIAKLNGIGDMSWFKIKEKIIKNYVLSDIITLLQPIGVTFAAIKSLLKYEPNPSILKQKIKDNPYIVTEAKGFGFIKADKFALKLDSTLINSGKRLFAFMKYTLNKAANDEGHTWVYFSILRNSIIDTIPQCLDLFDKLVDERNNGEFGGYFYINNDRIGLTKYKNCEFAIYDILTDLDTFKFNGQIDTDYGIATAEKALGYQLTEEQRNVIRQIEKSNVIMFTGKAGTGKSSSARAILESFIDCDIACCSLSAKAAQRIQEATGFKAMTIHRLLGYNGAVFAYDSNNRLPCDVVFIDEASMLNCTIFYYLLSSIKEGAKVIICGDFAQLPPIGAGNVFSDLLQMTGHFNISVLHKVHRQAEKSGILTDANKIRNGIYPIDAPAPQIVNGELKDMAYVFRDQRERIQDIVIKQYLKLSNAHGVDNVVVAVPRKDSVVNSALEINKRIQAELIDIKHQSFVDSFYNKFYIGDRVIQIENDAKKDIYNGEVGYVESVFSKAKPNEVCLVANFISNNGVKVIEYKHDDLKTIQLGYALSIHRLQGSEYPYCIVVLDNTHYTLLDTCLLYTAITRAKKLCLLISQPDAFKRAMTTNKNVIRQTWLKLKYIDGDFGDDV